MTPPLFGTWSYLQVPFAFTEISAGLITGDFQALRTRPRYKTHRWHPRQLRHNAATELRKEFGLEAPRIILGHRSAAITEVHAENDEQQAIEAMVKVG